MPLMLRSVPRCPLGAKPGSPVEMPAIIHSDKVDSAAKVVPRPTPPAVKTNLPTGKEETALNGQL